MSHLKILRGNLAHRILSNLTPKTKCKKIRQFHVSNRNSAIKTATVVEHNVLSSPWGEITIGNETLTQHVFQDVEKWSDAPCVVSTITLYKLKISGIIKNIIFSDACYNLMLH